MAGVRWYSVMLFSIGITSRVHRIASQRKIGFVECWNSV